MNLNLRSDLSETIPLFLLNRVFLTKRFSHVDVLSKHKQL